LISVVKLIGTIKAAYWIYSTLFFLLNHLLPQITSPAAKYLSKSKTEKPWVLVTGASDGIGAEYCRQLATYGFNICLVSRTLSKLQAVEADIKKISKVKTKLIVADFSAPDATNPKFFKDLLSQVVDLDIAIVIANAGLLFIG